tara:strand:- start:334 stop:750 length:417 start_codon:yes stop_codon:yes gene_type:complete
MAFPKVKISDDSGNAVAVDTSGASNALKVALVAGDAIDIGDVEIKGHLTVAHGSNTSVSDTTAGYLYGDATSVACKHVDIMAATTNTGVIYVGASGVSASTGIALYAGDVYSMDVENLRAIYVKASVDGEDVQWVVYS